MNRVTMIFSTVALLAAACGEPPTAAPASIEIDFNEGIEGELPRLDDPFSIEETRDLREGFDWATTTELPETDPDGQIALRSAIAYIGTEEERVLLDAVGPHSPLPMFAAERERWAEQVGRFGFFGDGGGLFHFVVLPASTYNVLRQMALDGEPPLQALILRDPPVAEVDNGDGSLDYQWLADRGFRMNDGASEEALQDYEEHEDHEDAEVSARSEPFLGFVIAFLASREVRDGIDDALGVVNRVGREGTNTVTLELGSTDRSHGGVTRAWGTTGPAGTNAGDPLVLRGVEVVGELDAGTSRGRTNAAGTATITVAVGARVFYCVRANNFAVQVDEGFEASQVCDFRDSGTTRVQNAVDEAEVTVRVADPIFNIVAQMTDGHDYARRVMGHDVSHRASVLVGFFADIFGVANGNRAFVLCGGYASALNLRWDAVASILGRTIALDPIGDALLRFVVDKILAHDVIFPGHGPIGGAASSRVAPSHEYGHFLQCDMMSTLGGDGDFIEGWGDVIDTSLFGGSPTAETESLVLTEGIADYFATQIAGGIDYFLGEPTSGSYLGGSFYCDPTSTACLEDNVGGPSQVVTLNQISNARTLSGREFDQELAMVTTLLTDAVDGPARTFPAGVSDMPSAGAFWDYDSTAFQLVPTAAFPTTSTLDELVSLSGAVMPDTFREMSTMGNTLNRRNFFGALARVARRDHSDTEVCDMFALHSPDGMCTGLVDSRDLMGAPVTPARPTIVLGSVDMTNRGSWTWTDMSSAATGYAVEVVAADGSLAVPRMTRRYTRRATFAQGGLDFDTAFTFRVATVNGPATGDFSEHTVHSFAEPVPTARATPLRGAARLRWDAVEATEYTVHDVTGGGDVLAARTTGTEVTIRGLAAGVERTYVIVSHNAIGLPSDASAPVRVTPLAPNRVYVATSGSDTHPSAGAPLNPYRTLRSALAGAAATGADEVVLEGASFTETGPLLINHSVTILGGFSLAGGRWEPGRGQTEVTVYGGVTVASCTTDSFNARGRATSAAVSIAAGASVMMRNVDLRAERAGLAGSECFAAIHAGDAGFTFEEGNITTAGSATSRCVAGVVVTRAGSLALRDSMVSGAHFRTSSVPPGLDAAGIAACGGATLTVERAVVSGIEAPSVSSPSTVGAVVGVAGHNLAAVRVQRSAIDSVAGAYGWHANGGLLRGIQVTATGRVFIANSVVRTSHGADDNRAIDVGSGVGPLSSFQLYHVTAVIGADWDAAAAVPLPFWGAVVSMSGNVLDVAMFNNLLSYAGGGVDRASGTTFTGIDRVATTADPLTFAFEGNVVSIPYVSDWHYASLTTCGTWEFGTTRSEWRLNTPAAHQCHWGARGSWEVARNAAFTSPMGRGPRAVVEFSLDGHAMNPSAAFIVGEPVGSLPRGSEVMTDYGEHPRSTSPGVGAWAP